MTMPLSAASRPDFSGEWRLLIDKSIIRGGYFTAVPGLP